ncbi:caspase family protein [Flavobacterium helocola]|uniref:Caspase family protein n=1 Tax=Flavobacterium helocola TaxID=3139139 RepID=A0ABU9I832_9FLAO
MIDNIKQKSFAIIIAIEDYRFSDEKTGINSVKYARNDASKFKKLLKEDFGLLEEDILMWTDKDATKSALEDELKYHIRQLTKENRFYFYYAGHGFYQNGYNKLTCWDSHPDNLDGTTVSIKEILLDPLEASECTQSLIFLDSCSTYLKNNIVARDLISNFNNRELENFLKSEKYHAIFMSCSPGEKSYPNDVLKHGIWTWHLIEALKGNVPEVILKDEFITDTTLKNYLSDSVPKYITQKTIFRNTQKPFAKINSSNDFLIRKIEKPELEINQEFPKLSLKFDSITLRRIIILDIRSAQGFKKNHFIPEKNSPSGNSFIQSLFEQELKDEIQEVYVNTKEVLSFRKRQIEYGAESGYGNVENDVFRFFIEIEQNPLDPSQAKVTRKLQIRVNRNQLPENFDDIFPNQIDEIVIPIEGNIDFDELVEKFENLADEDGGKLSDNELKGEIEYQTYSGLSIKISTKNMELIINPNRDMKCLELIDSSIEGLKKISGTSIKFLN